MIFILFLNKMLVDTNVLIYAINSDSPKNKQAQIFLQKYRKELIVAHQNIFEALRVLTHPKYSKPMSPRDAQEAVLAILKACRVIIPDYNTYYLAFELIKEHNLLGNRIFDAYLGATAISNGIRVIATDNEKDFKKFGVTVYNPFQASI